MPVSEATKQKASELIGELFDVATKARTGALSRLDVAEASHAGTGLWLSYERDQTAEPSFGASDIETDNLRQDFYRAYVDLCDACECDPVQAGDGDANSAIDIPTLLSIVLKLLLELWKSQQ